MDHFWFFFDSKEFERSMENFLTKGKMTKKNLGICGENLANFS